jgi:hypothetical protein
MAGWSGQDGPEVRREARTAHTHPSLKIMANAPSASQQLVFKGFNALL